VREIVGGSHPSWCRFLEGYSGLIQAVIRRYLYSRDRDDVRTVYVDVLDSLYRHKLATYRGQAALSTWLTLVTRTAVLDFLRHRFGRREVPRALRMLDAEDREVFRLYYIEGLDLRELTRRLSLGPVAWTVARVLEAFQRIEDRLSSRWLRRISYDLHAQSAGAASGRMLEYLDHVRGEYQHLQEASWADYDLVEREARRMAVRVAARIESLPPEERRLLTLRFQKGWPARRIAEELGLPGPRDVYTVIDRIVRGLRRILKAEDQPKT
jgi:DNA-directed RNA polymerase specialized sigma24 family protein